MNREQQVRIIQRQEMLCTCGHKRLHHCACHRACIHMGCACMMFREKEVLTMKRFLEEKIHGKRTGG